MHTLLLACWRAAFVLFVGSLTVFSAEQSDDGCGCGELRGKRGETTVFCPLVHTDVDVHITGHLARVEVSQRFRNETDEPIEAIYIFPLPHKAAVDRMRLVVGERRVIGIVLKRADAAKAYEDAIVSGKTAALLDQERPNIFTQSVGNIPPRSDVLIEISYVDHLEPDRNEYEFHFPMVVGPRYIPGSPTANNPPSGTGMSPDTDRVHDASRISPPVLKSGQRNGHDISLRVDLDAGLPIHGLRVPSHEVTMISHRPNRANVSIKDSDSIPNKDFVLRWSLTGERPQASMLTYRPRYEDDGYFLLTLQPGAVDEALKDEKPRDFCFLIDVSGSMSGAPLEQVKSSIRALFTQFGPHDRLQVVAFAGSSHRLFSNYVEADAGHRDEALADIQNMQAGGGTEMLRGFEEVLKDPLEDGRSRCVILLSDGFIGNEAEILRVVADNVSDRQRFIGLGIGTAVNRALFDGIGGIGGGISRTLLLADDPAVELRDLLGRLRKGQLTQINIDWSEVGPAQVFPSRLPDLYSGSPLVVVGRYHGEGKRTINLHGKAGDADLTVPIEIDLNEVQAAHDAIAPTWARRAIEDFDRQFYAGKLDAVKREQSITKLALENHLVSAYTSLVAVDEAKLEEWVGKQPKKVTVQVPLPEGVSEAAIPFDIPVGELKDMSCAPMSCEDEDAEFGESGAFMAVGAGGGARGMWGHRHGGAMKAAGGKAVVQTVESGPNWLKRHQGSDGSWTCAGYVAKCSDGSHCEPGRDALGGGAGDTLCEALAIHSYAAAGYDHRTPSKYKVLIKNALAHLLDIQSEDGSFAANSWANVEAARAVCALFILTNDPALKDPADRAVKFVIASQIRIGNDRFGWSAEASKPMCCDTLTTMWNIALLRVAGTARVGVNADINESISGAKVWFDRSFAAMNAHSAGDTADFPDTWDAATGQIVGSDRAHAGLYAALLLGKMSGDAALDRLSKQTLAVAMPIAKAWPCELARTYVTTSALALLAGDAWTQWSQAVRPAILGAQRKTQDCFDGSWDPAGTGAPVADLGRMASTTFAQMILARFGQPTAP